MIIYHTKLPKYPLLFSTFLNLVHDSGLAPLEHIISCWADTNVLNRHAEEFFNVVYIVSGSLREVVVGGGIGGGLSWPARHSMVYWLHPLQYRKISWKRLELNTVNPVSNCNLKLLQAVQDIELSKIDACIVVDGVGVFRND